MYDLLCAVLDKPSIHTKNFKCLASAIPEIRGGSPNLQIGQVTTPPGPDSLRCTFAQFSLGPPALYRHAKFQVSSFSRAGDMRGVSKFNSRSRDPASIHLWPTFALFSYRAPNPLYAHKFSSLKLQPMQRHEGVPKFKSKSYDPAPNPHNPFCNCFFRAPSPLYEYKI